MNQVPEGKSGLSRIWAALFYSLDGLRHAMTKETAFVQETIVLVVAAIVLIFLPLSMLWKALLFFVTAAVLVVELLNSAIESLVDMVSPEYHELAKTAKDLGSAAVLLSISSVVILWLMAFISLVE